MCLETINTQYQDIRKKRADGKGPEIKIYQDENGFSPREWDYYGYDDMVNGILAEWELKKND